MRTLAIKFTLFLGCLLVLYLFGRVYSADVHFKASRALLSDQSLSEALVESNLAVSLNPWEPSYRLTRARIYLSQAQGLSEDTSNSLRLEALNDLQAAFNLNSKNLTTIRNSLPLYYLLAQNSEMGFLSYAREYFNFVKRTYPTDAGALVAVAKYEKELNLLEEVEITKNLIKVDRADLLEWHEDVKDL